MPDPPQTRSIFISYRRDDTGGEAGRLFDDLVRAFDQNTVFMDVDGIEPGKDFRQAIEENVSTCGVLLAVIGRQWVTLADSTGTPRLGRANDFVHLEIASALARNIPVIPVLVHGASMPVADTLPTDLQDLAFRNGVELTLPRWNSDVALLVNALKRYVHVAPETATQTVHATLPVQLPAPDAPASTRRTRPRTPLIFAAVLVPLAIGVPLVVHLLRPAPPPKPVPDPIASTKAVPILTPTPGPAPPIVKPHSQPVPLSMPDPTPIPKTTSKPGLPSVSRAKAQFQVPLPYNAVGLLSDGAMASAKSGISAQAQNFPAFTNLLSAAGSTYTTRDGTTFKIAPPNVDDAIRSTPENRVVLTLPHKSFSSVCLLAAASYAPYVVQLTVAYDGPSPNKQSFRQSMNDWTHPDKPRFPNETEALTQTYYNKANGTKHPGSYALSQYCVPLDATRTLDTLTLPGNGLMLTYAVTLLP